METLRLTLKQPYFDQIKNGTKIIEYREVNPYWTSRLYDKAGKNATMIGLNSSMGTTQIRSG